MSVTCFPLDATCFYLFPQNLIVVIVLVTDIDQQLLLQAQPEESIYQVPSDQSSFVLLPVVVV